MIFTYEQKLLNQVILHANDVPTRGLFSGQMGITLVLAEYARLRKLHHLYTAIDFLLDEILSNLLVSMSLCFTDGLTGIGWGVEYLIQKKLRKGSAIEVCEEIDHLLLQQNILRISNLGLDTGFEGWLHYIIAHIQGGRENKKKVFDKYFLDDVHQKCLQLLNQDISPSLRILCFTYINMLNEGSAITYKFDLSTFVSSGISKGEDRLGLHRGLSGLLFTAIKDELL